MNRYCLDTNTLVSLFYESSYQGIGDIEDPWGLLAANKEHLIIIKLVYDEIVACCEHKDKDDDSNSLVDWLEEHHFSYAPITLADEHLALNIRQEYKPRPKNGISEVDAILIAYTENRRSDLVDSFCLVTEEKHQPDKSQLQKRNYKIPSVCEERDIRCINLIDLLRELSSGIE